MEELKLFERDTVGGGFLAYSLESMCIPDFIYSVTCMDVDILVCTFSF